jgi:hypothetical protein
MLAVPLLCSLTLEKTCMRLGAPVFVKYNQDEYDLAAAHIHTMAQQEGINL